jgi:hypothetical protein
LGLAKNWHQTEDAKIRISETLKRRIELGEIKKPGPAIGHFVSEETKRKIGLKSAGRMHSEETKQKMSDAKKNYVPWNKGRSASPEVKLRLQTMNIGRKHDDEYRKKLSEIVTKRVIQKGENYISKDQRDSISRAQKGVLDGPLPIEQRDKISAGVSAGVLNGKYKNHGEYAGIKMQSDAEVLFAMWCDKNKMGWKYQPTSFFVKRGRRYIPDFLLISSGEFVEVENRPRHLLPPRKIEKLDAFVNAGNILHYVNPKEFVRIENKTKW